MIQVGRAIAEDLELADLVGQRLAGPGDVAVDLHRSDLNCADESADDRCYVSDRLVTAPMFVVQAGVGNQSGRPKRVVIEAAEFGIGIGVESDLAGQPLAVQGPKARPERSTQ